MYDLKKLYAHILKSDTYVGKPQLNEVYERAVLEEAYTRPIPDTFDFNRDNVTTDWTSWDELQRSLFDRVKTGGGRGEYSVAALLMSRLDPVLYEKYVQGITTKGLEYIVSVFASNADNKNIVQGGGKGYDILYPDTELKYEVKELGESRSSTVKTGKEGYKVARLLLNKVHDNINTLHEKYSSLSPEVQSIVNQDKSTKVFRKKYEVNRVDYTIGPLLEKLYNRLESMPGELPRSMIFSEDKDKESSIPSLSILPELIEKLYKNPQVKETMPETAQWIKDVYNIDSFNARYLDAYIRSYLKIDPKTASPEVQLSDFILYCATSIFNNKEKYKTEVQNYFIPGTEQHRKAIGEVLPVVGVFTVSKTGYKYSGTVNMEKNIVITNISAGTFKIGSTDQETASGPDVGAP